MLPLKRSGGHRVLEPAVKSLILETVREVYPAQYGRMIWREHKTGHASGSLGKLDLVPYSLSWIYRLKRSRNRRLTGVLDRLRRNSFFYSDRMVRYPDPRRINRHVLNLHRERWFYPAGGRGLHYESAEDLFRMSVDRTVEIWEKMESRFYRKEKDLSDVMKMLRANALTGETDKEYADLKIAEPVRLQF
jgi:hypothetical protein